MLEVDGLTALWMEERSLGRAALIGVLLGVVDVGIPFLFLKDVGSFWASFLFWVVLSFLVLVWGVWRVNRWGEKR